MLGLLIWCAASASGAAEPALPSTQAFQPGEAPPVHRLEGTLSIAARGLQVVEHNRVPFYPEIAGDLPDFSVDLVSDGALLIPLDRGYRVTSHPAYDLFVSPGQAWHDRDRDVASLPFTLIARGVGCTHNGLVRFEYSADGIHEAEVLVNQETCHFAKFDLWGEVEATFERRPLAGGATAREQYRAERAASIPTKDFAALDALGIDTQMLPR